MHLRAITAGEMVIVAAGRSTVAGAEVQRGVGAGVAVAIEAGNEVELEVEVSTAARHQEGPVLALPAPR